jgi:hypothetical protein
MNILSTFVIVCGALVRFAVYRLHRTPPYELEQEADQLEKPFVFLWLRRGPAGRGRVFCGYAPGLGDVLGSGAPSWCG